MWSYFDTAVIFASIYRPEKGKRPRHSQLVRLTNSSRSEMYDFEDDTRPMISTHKRKTSTMIVKTVPPTPLDVSTLLSCKINYIVVLMLLIPSLIYSKPTRVILTDSNYLQDILYRPSGRISQITHHDIITMAWTHFLVAIAGAFTPVLHLLCDDWISTLGLESLRSLQFTPKLDCFNRIMAFLNIFTKNCGLDNKKTKDSLGDTDPGIEQIKYKSTYIPNMKQHPKTFKPDDFSNKFAETPSNVKNEANYLGQHVSESNDISSSIAKTSNVAKTNFSPNREIEESIDIQNSSSAKNSTYDDLIELKDDLHYL